MKYGTIARLRPLTLETRPSLRLTMLAFIGMPATFWGMLWLGIDTGPWMLREIPSSLLGWAHLIRTVFPLLVLMAPLTLARVRGDLPPMAGPLLLWLAYGMIAFLASFNSPRPMMASLYWASVYLAVFAGLVMYLHGPDPLARARQLNHLSWLVTTAFLIVIVLLAREYLAEAASAYNIRREVGQTSLGMAVPRSTGAARFAAVPGILGFTFLLGGRSLRWRGVGLAAFAAAAFLIYLFQARTVIFGFGAALALVMWFYSSRTRMLGVALGLVCALLLLSEMLPQQLQGRFIEHIFRGDPYSENVWTFGGRLRPWQNAVRESWNAPLWGFGHQSDRVLLGELVHNTYLYALMAAGYTGLLLFLAGLAWVWRMFLTIGSQFHRVSPTDHLMTIQAGAILLFFTLRSVTELSGVSFSVDTMLLVPIVAYFTLLSRQLTNGSLKISSGGEHASRSGGYALNDQSN